MKLPDWIARREVILSKSRRGVALQCDFDDLLECNREIAACEALQAPAHHWLDEHIAQQKVNFESAGISEDMLADAAEYVELDEVEDSYVVNIERH